MVGFVFKSFISLFPTSTPTSRDKQREKEKRKVGSVADQMIRWKRAILISKFCIFCLMSCVALLASSLILSH